MPKILVVAEHDAGQLKLATLSAVSFARKVIEQSGGTFEILVLGESVSAVAESLTPYGAAGVLVADHAELRNPLADRWAATIASVVRERSVEWVVSASSTFSKDILPRAAGLLDAAMASDVIEARADGADFVFRRVLYAGNAIAAVRLEGAIRFFTVRSAAFPAPAREGKASPVLPVNPPPEALKGGMEFEGRAAKAAGRPDSTEARIVVSGGRAIKNSEDFEKLVGGLADVVGAAVGSSRALVDSGITPNDLQIGQTGKVVAPDLYIAVGISGAIQHLAGMKDTKVIVAINKDAEAPIFEVADYGLVADVYEAVPELIGKLKK